MKQAVTAWFLGSQQEQGDWTVLRERCLWECPWLTLSDHQYKDLSIYYNLLLLLYILAISAQSNSKKQVEQTYISRSCYPNKLQVHSSKEYQDCNIAGCVRVIMICFLLLLILDFENTWLEQRNLWILNIFHFQYQPQSSNWGNKKERDKMWYGKSHKKRKTNTSQEFLGYFDSTRNKYLFFPLFSLSEYFWKNAMLRFTFSGDLKLV